MTIRRFVWTVVHADSQRGNQKMCVRNGMHDNCLIKKKTKTKNETNFRAMFGIFSGQVHVEPVKISQLCDMWSLLVEKCE